MSSYNDYEVPIPGQPTLPTRILRRSLGSKATSSRTALRGIHPREHRVAPHRGCDSAKLSEAALNVRTNFHSLNLRASAARACRIRSLSCDDDARSRYFAGQVLVGSLRQPYVRSFDCRSRGRASKHVAIAERPQRVDRLAQEEGGILPLKRTSSVF